MNYLKEILNLIELSEQEYEANRIQLSNIDLKKADIEHAIELQSLKDVTDGYKMYTLLKDVLEERRIIKDKSDELHQQNIYLMRAKDILMTCKSKDRQTKCYKTRVLTDKFSEIIYKGDE